MKLLLVLVAAAFSLFSTVSLFAADSVRVVGKVLTDHDDPKGQVGEVVKKTLVLDLAGNPVLESGAIQVKATFYADDLGTNQVVPEKELKATAALVRGRAALSLPVVTFNFTPAHAKTTGSGRRAKAVRVPASGRRYHGWAVEVFDGNRKLGEAYSHPSLKPKD